MKKLKPDKEGFKRCHRITQGTRSGANRAGIKCIKKAGPDGCGAGVGGGVGGIGINYEPGRRSSGTLLLDRDRSGEIRGYYYVLLASRMRGRLNGKLNLQNASLLRAFLRTGRRHCV